MKTSVLLNKSISKFSLLSSTGNEINLCDFTRVVLFFHPGIMNPGDHIPPGWLTHPGAVGCTEQACEFRDHHEYLKRTGTELFGVSNRNRTELFVTRNQLSLPFELLSDEDFKCRNHFGLPTILVDGKEYYSRLTMVIEKSVIKKIYYPVDIPGMNVHDVIDFIQSQEN